MVARSGVFSGAFWQVGVGEEAAKRDKSWVFVASPIGLAPTQTFPVPTGRGFFRAKFCLSLPLHPSLIAASTCKSADAWPLRLG